MSSVKRKRVSDPLVLQPIQLGDNAISQSNSAFQQPIVLGPVVDHGNPILENSQIHIMNNSNIIATDPNGQTNTFIVVPQNGADNTQTILQSIPVYLLVPREQTQKSNDCDALVESSPQPAEVQKESIVIKDVRTIKSEEEENEKYPETIYLDSIDESPEDPLTLPVPNQITSADGSVLYNVLKHRSLYKCDFPNCTRTFLYPHDRKVHRECHIFPVNTEYKCSLCNMTFDKAVERNKHVESHSVANTYKCKFCMATFPYYTTLIQHMNKNCFWDDKFKCKYCHILFANQEDVRHHEEKLHISHSKQGAPSKPTILNNYPRLRRLGRRINTPVLSDNVIVLD